jgi:hypothetical protein
LSLSLAVAFGYVQENQHAPLIEMSAHLTHFAAALVRHKTLAELTAA